jgi:hypothetical protein
VLWSELLLNLFGGELWWLNKTQFDTRSIISLRHTSPANLELGRYCGKKLANMVNITEKIKE